MATARRVFIKSIESSYDPGGCCGSQQTGAGAATGSASPTSRTPFPWTPDSITNLLSKEIGGSLVVMFEELFYQRVPQFLAAYLAASWGVIEAVDPP